VDVGVAVRVAELRDAPELARLRWEFRPEDQHAQDFDGFSRDFEGWFAGAVASDWMAAVAERDDGELVGCIFLRSVSKVPNPGAMHRRWGYVTNSYVAPLYRGKGVGRELLDILVQAGRERDHEFLIVWPSEEAVSFYARAGFREVSKVHSGHDDYPPLELRLL
jgi:ribosomal protein S18 acetylase RimI-like enzyme